MVELEFVRTYDAPRQLVWDDGFPDGSVKSTATATFTEVDASTTRLTVHLVADFSDTVRAGAERGWSTQLDKLVDYLATHGRRFRAVGGASNPGRRSCC